MKITPKLTATFILIAFLSMLIVGLISFYRAKTSFQAEAFNRLTAVREMKSSQITTYFNQIKDQMLSFSENPAIKEAMKEFKYGFNNLETDISKSSITINKSKQHLSHYLDSIYIPELNKNTIVDNTKEDLITNNTKAIFLQDLYISSNPAEKGSKELLDSINTSCSYNTTHIKYHPVIRKFAERFGFYDVFLIDNKTGNVVYTVYKELDFATNLKSGPFSKTNFAKCFNEALKVKEKGNATVVDFDAYLPSLNEQASFIACPIFEGTEIIGVLAFQMPIDNINNIMTSNHDWKNVGLGETGETYIVGENYTLRNQSRFLIEDSTQYFNMLKNIGTDQLTINKIKEYKSSIGLQTVKTLGTKEALNGKTDTKVFKDYRGVSVLSAYKPLTILGMHWAMMSEIDEEEAFAPVVVLRNNIIQGFVLLIILVIIVSVIISKKITKPLKELTVDAEELSKGNFDVVLKIDTKDEIGTLADAFKKMQTSISNLVHGLEDTVKERTAEVVMQKDIIESKQKEMVDSINYAKRIQYSILADDRFLQRYLKEYCVVFNPKDIVSGDFYWATFAPSSLGIKGEGRFYLAVCDSTGHGVPGAFMSLLNITFLNEAINNNKITSPSLILDYVRDRLVKNISKNGGQDGMDGILICMDTVTKKITYSAANNSPLLIRDNSFIELQSDKMPIGIGLKDVSFTEYELEYQKDDVLFLYTDGYADQFGGPKGKKFKHKQLKDKLTENCHLPLEKQKEILNSAFDSWKGELEQVDDVCIIGIRL